MINSFYNKILAISKRKSNYLFFLTLFFVIFLSIFPRCVEILNQNSLFLFDQGREMLAAKKIVVDHKFILIGTEIGAGDAGISGVFHGPLYYYMLSIIFILFNGDPQGGIYLMFGFGLLSIAFGYYVGYRMFGKWVGLLLSLLISISPIFIAQSRFIWSPNPPTLFMLAAFYCTYIISKNKSLLFTFLAAFFSGFVYNFELGVAVPMSLTLLIYSFFLFKKQIKNYVFLIAGFVMGYLPMFLFEIRHDFLGLRGIITYLFKHKVATHSVQQTNFLVDHFNSFINSFSSTFPFQFLFQLVFLFIIVVSIYYIRKEKVKYLKYFFSFLLLLIPVTYLVFSPLRNTVYGIYLQHLNVAYLLLTCYIVYSSFKYNIKLFLIVLLFILINFPIGLYSAVATTIHDYPDYGGIAKIRGKIDVVDFIYKDANKKPFGLLVFTPPVYTYPYDYLLWWYGRTKYNYVPYSEKKGVFYLLMEPDPSKPWSYNGWLETVVKDGKVEWTKTLPSGFVVQKRKL